MANRKGTKGQTTIYKTITPLTNLIKMRPPHMLLFFFFYAVAKQNTIITCGDLILKIDNIFGGIFQYIYNPQLH